VLSALNIRSKEHIEPLEPKMLIFANSEFCSKISRGTINIKVEELMTDVAELDLGPATATASEQTLALQNRTRPLALLCFLPSILT
jgi:hypothetical protein